MSSASEITKKLQKDYGPSIAKRGSDDYVDTPRLPTGIFPFDLASGGGFPMGRVSIVFGPESSGKCHAKGDRVLMFNGGSKPVEEVKVGDILMGVDSTPRTVLGIGGGFGDLFRITPVKGGGAFHVNEDHQLHLVCTQNQGFRRKGDKVQVSVKDYLTKSKDWKIYHHIYRVGVDFPAKQVSLSPYFLGLWLGDGSSTNMQVYSTSEEIIDWLQGYADNLGGTLSVYDRESPCPGYAIVGTHLRDVMNSFNLFGNKHIPDRYLYNSREVRLGLLAGLIDTDGAKGSGSSCTYYASNQELCAQVQWLAQSLGYYASTSFKKTTCNGNSFDSWVVYISMDDPTELPLLLEYKRPDMRSRAGSCLTSRFTVDAVGAGEFFGFEVGGDHLYMTDNFIVNHNTNVVLKAIGRGQLIYPDKVAVFVDAEHAFDPVWARALGVNTDKLIVIHPEYAEQAVDMIEAFLYASDVFCVTLDSIAALSTQNEIESSAEKASVGGASLIIGKLFKKATVSFNRMRNQGQMPPAFIGINQIRIKIGQMFGDPEIMPGGNSIKFASSFTVRIYGKNLMDKKLHPVLPSYKETSIIIRKWKMPICAPTAVYNMQMLEAGGKHPGHVEDWATLKSYLAELDYLNKGDKGGWILFGDSYPTLDAVRSYLYGNDDVLMEVQSSIITEVLAKGSMSPKEETEEAGAE